MNRKDLFGSPPEWASKAIVYQIFPDRFRRSGLVEQQNQLSLKPWGSDPAHQGFQGGDLYGVIEALDHLQDLGINCIYLTPIFSSAANHRYHTYDYLNVDPILGGNSALEALIDEIHRRKMKIILDGVFNHCSRGFWAFHHLLENGKNSPYREWFHVNKWPLKPYNRGKDCGYRCWWDNPALPKFNHSHQPVRDYLIKVASYWLEFGIDGWRLDVPDEVPLDFWTHFRRSVKEISLNTWIIGEIWGDARTWLDGAHFDGVMNYRMGWSSLCWVAGDKLRKNYNNPDYPLEKINADQYINLLETTLGWYRPEFNCSQLNLLDSHDVPRSLHTLKGDMLALKLALFLLFIQPGAPCIYYGTEAGLSGGIEPKCREAFPWNETWPEDLRSFIRSLSSLRKKLSNYFERGLCWEPLGADALSGVGNLNIKKSSKLRKVIKVFVNRSRSSWLSIDDALPEETFLIGSLEKNGRGLSPQSAVVFLAS